MIFFFLNWDKSQPWLTGSQVPVGRQNQPVCAVHYPPWQHHTTHITPIPTHTTTGTHTHQHRCTHINTYHTHTLHTTHLPLSHPHWPDLGSAPRCTQNAAGAWLGAGVAVAAGGRAAGKSIMGCIVPSQASAWGMCSTSSAMMVSLSSNPRTVRSRGTSGPRRRSL